MKKRFLISNFSFFICVSIDIHLTMGTIELKTEASPVAKTEEERFAPRRTLTAVTDAIAKGVAETVATLHQDGVGRGAKLVG